MASKVDARLLKSTKFPPEFSKKVDMQKVNLQVMKKWIANKISDILGNEDDVVIELCFNLIEGSRHPDVKSLQIQLTGFLDKDTAPFCKDLWNLLLSAQGSPQGVPKELLEAKKLELMQEKRDADRAVDEARKRREYMSRRDREVSDHIQRDRHDQANNPADSWQGRRGNQNFDNRSRREDQDRAGKSGRPSEPPPRGSRDSYGRDSYIPNARRGRDHDRRHRRGRSFSEDESSRSRSRDRSVSGDSQASNSPSRRRISPLRQRGSRKRSRSPRGDAYRPRRDRRDDRTHRSGPSRQSRSVSSGRSSPAKKKRKGSESRSRSPPRRRRRSRSSSASSSRSRSRSRDKRSPPRRRQKRHYSDESENADHPEGHRRKNHGNHSPRSERQAVRRRNSSSASSNHSERGNLDEVSEDDGRSP
ncbi:hypothetical protein QQS21_010274 [Conoideocrella luteorostrata]|uniref:PWI domain-containing protein n=1 Tax=Conoideocrella luteorostrata TaxID=1105319 RepID=A0AAJ0CJT9_9HYPO|nr:hypothetical protein QQS21_010274 [Conoideocrella luteorostrata]